MYKWRFLLCCNIVWITLDIHKIEFVTILSSHVQVDFFINVKCAFLRHLMPQNYDLLYQNTFAAWLRVAFPDIPVDLDPVRQAHNEYQTMYGCCLTSRHRYTSAKINRLRMKNIFFDLQCVNRQASKNASYG